MSSDSQSEYEPTPPSVYQMRQSWSIDKTQRSLGLVSEALENTADEHFVNTVNIAQNLWENFKNAAEHQPGGAILQSGLKDAIWPGMPKNPELQPTLGELYAKAECLTGANFEILTDGFGDYQTFPNWLKSEVSKIINSYGLKVEPTEDTRSAPQKQNKVIFMGIEENSDSAQVMFERAAIHLGVPKGKWKDPTYYQLIALLVGVEKLAIESKKGVELSSTLTPKNGPSIHQRYQTTVNLMEALRGIIEGELKGVRVPPTFLQETIGAGLTPYGLQIKETEDTT